MGNCQAAEAATVVIHHPGNKIERIYWSVSARQVMNSNPGYYVALLITKSHNGTLFNQFKLLRPHDTLLIGQVYRLISFQDLLKEFATKKCAKLGKLLQERGALGIQMRHFNSNPNPGTVKVDEEVHGLGSYGGGSKSNKGGGRHFGGQWRPALQSIAETGA